MYVLERDAPGNFAVYASLAQCGPGAQVSCARRVYVYYKCPTCTAGAFFTLWMNPDQVCRRSGWVSD